MSIKDQPIVVSGKTTAELQVEKATLKNACEVLVGEINTLSSQKIILQKQIEIEMNLRNNMVLKTTAEMQSDLEEKITGHQNTLQQLQVTLNDLKTQVFDKQNLRDNINNELQTITTEYINIKLRLENEILNLQKNIADFKQKEIDSRTELEKVNIEFSDILKNITQAKKDLEFYKQQQKDHENYLNRKERDLTIWHKRLEPFFKEQFPNGEMRFV